MGLKWLELIKKIKNNLKNFQILVNPYVVKIYIFFKMLPKLIKIRIYLIKKKYKIQCEKLQIKKKKWNTWKIQNIVNSNYYLIRRNYDIWLEIKITYYEKKEKISTMFKYLFYFEIGIITFQKIYIYTVVSVRYLNKLRLYLKHKKILFIVKKYIYKFIIINLKIVKYVVLLAIICIYYFILIFYSQTDATKQLITWFTSIMCLYTLFTTFNYFCVIYKYSKFTTSIQRFWKRTIACFWLLEGFLFTMYYYYYFNSSQEPLYFYDSSDLNKDILLCLNFAFKTNFILFFIIIFSYILLKQNNYLKYNQKIILIHTITVLTWILFYVESYQFFYLINFFDEKFWVFEEYSNMWVLEAENPSIRVRQQYFSLCLIAKYWHFILIFISWNFFILKFFENKKINYNIFGYVLQNFFILYILNIFSYLYWIKWLFKKFIEVVYFCFFLNYEINVLEIIFFEICLLTQNTCYYAIHTIYTSIYCLLTLFI